MPSAVTDVQQKLKLADGSHIREAISRLTCEFKAGQWLGPQNPYCTDAATMLNHTQAGEELQHQELIEYIAVSAIHHCFDGWSYLGHALQAEMACDPDVARHLGYYAELRAAMSLLASEGIGVFDRTHVVVRSEGRCHSIEAGGTHQFVWEALEHWADANAQDVLLRVIVLSGLPLSDWLDQFSSGGVQALAADWLKRWGLDLKRYHDDRKARNTASYRPTALVSSGPRAIDDIMRSVLQFWRGFQPTESATFYDLDLWLLRSILEDVYRNNHDESAREAPEDYLNRVDRMLDSLGLFDASKQSLRQFLDPTVKYPDQILSDARSTKPVSNVNHSKQLLARAALLLRLATGCARELLAGTEPREILQFWWSQPGVSRRLWRTDDPPSPFSDLWEDVRESMDSVEGWLNNGRATDPCAHDFWNKHAADASVLSTTERICLWGLGL